MQGLNVSEKMQELATLWSNAAPDIRVYLSCIFSLSLIGFIAAFIYCTPRRTEAKNLDLKYLLKKL